MLCRGLGYCPSPSHGGWYLLLHAVYTCSIQPNQFTWLVVATNQLQPLSCGQLVHNRATSCTNVYLNILQAIPPSWVGGPPLIIAVYLLIIWESFREKGPSVYYKKAITFERLTLPLSYFQHFIIHHFSMIKYILGS